MTEGRQEGDGDAARPDAAPPGAAGPPEARAARGTEGTDDVAAAPAEARTTTRRSAWESPHRHPADSPTEVMEPVDGRPPEGHGGASSRGDERVTDDDDRLARDDEPPGQDERPRRDPLIEEFPEQEHRRRWPRVLAVTAVVLVLLGGAYVAALWHWSDRVPPGTTVAGVGIGGMTAPEAVSTLEESLAAVTAEPVPVAAGERRTTVDPRTAGLELDEDATVDAVTGFGLEPARLWRHLFGGGPLEPVTAVDDAALRDAVDAVVDDLGTEPVDGTVVFVDGTAQGTQPVEGTTVDPAAAAELVAEGWLTAPRPLELPTEPAPPRIDSEEVDRVLAEVARPLVAAPVTVAVGEQLAELPPDVLAGAASFVPSGATLELVMDGEALVEAVIARTTDLLAVPTEASFAFENGAPVVVGGQPGTGLDPDALAEAVAAAGTGPDRTARVDLVAVDPEQSVADLEALGVTQVVSEFSTPLTSEPRRTQNIINGASKINGTLVRPEEVFSLSEQLVPIDAANGYVQAGAIVDGEHVDAWGGGLSQVSTTMYNAAYFAGFEDVEHHPHSEWFARYPEGREATIYTGQLDMRWGNNTPYGALVQSWVDGGRLHVRIWSTPYWTVESSTSPRRDVVQPRTVYSQSPTCEPQAAGNPGFTVTVTRRVLLDGVEQDTETWTVRYRPQNRIICGPEPTG